MVEAKVANINSFQERNGVVARGARELFIFKE